MSGEDHPEMLLATRVGPTPAEVAAINAARRKSLPVEMRATDPSDAARVAARIARRDDVARTKRDYRE